MVYLHVISRKDSKKMKSENTEIVYAFGACPFGKCLLGILFGQICHLSFVTVSEEESLTNLKNEWEDVKGFVQNDEVGFGLIKDIFNGDSKSLEVIVKGTEFEAKIWEALLSIPAGKVVCYSEVGRTATKGTGSNARAVGNAVARNPIAFIIPCHRVVRKDGRIHRYKWGAQLKEKILKFEAENFR